MKKDKDFDFTNLPLAARDPEISQEDFVLQQADKAIHEQKFQTKPTTFFKDSLKRFTKNKSSVVATFILGILIALAIFVPIFDKNDVSQGAPDNAYFYLEPKLFDNANGFWDGTVKRSSVPVDTSKSDDPTTWYPDPDSYKLSGISNYRIDGTRFTSTINKFARGGYARIGYYSSYGLTEATMTSVGSSEAKHSAKLDLSTTTLTLKNFDTVDADKIRAYYEIDKTTIPNIPALPADVLPQNFVLGLTTLEFCYSDEVSGKDIMIPVTDAKEVHNTGTDASLGLPDREPINITQKVLDYIADPSHELTPKTKFDNFWFQIRVKGEASTPSDKSVCTLLKSLQIECDDSGSKELKAFLSGGTFTEKIGGNNINVYFPGVSFETSNDFLLRETKFKVSSMEYKNSGYWSIESIVKMSKTAHLAVCTYASFTYDTYLAAFGRTEGVVIGEDDFYNYEQAGYLEYEITYGQDVHGKIIVTDFELTILDPAQCPIIEDVLPEDVYFVTSSNKFAATCTVNYYRYLGLPSIPKYIMGTDKSGRDMFKYVFEGLRNSLLLGLVTFLVCFVFGLIYGAIAGYFGGTVDLVMERITDVLSGIPWIVLMTIIILKIGQNFTTFALALCLTGWIGTASTTRTQFYRFRGREYVLASRTLGASDARLIAKHILPNAMGTIITGAVLMIPSVIFSEATISYLGLGFKGMSSLGVILSANQVELLTHPYLLLFPSVVIALVMISFNLFGNGLRDAINPSLKGEGE